MDVRTRFAPSPTGDLHWGGVRTAIFNWWYAQANNGKFYIRIEDTDRTRYVEGATERLLSDLSQVITWDEGPDVGGPHEPYVQSERKERYLQASEFLLENDLAYRVFDDNFYRWRSSKKLLGDKLSKIRPFHIRLKLPREGVITTSDLIRGEITWRWNKIRESSDQSIADPVLLKTDGMPTYHLASVVDDIAMKTSHVFRGQEWLSSLPMHVYLYNCFGVTPPKFGHLSVVLNPFGKGKMSKRSLQGSGIPVFLYEFLKAGVLPQTMIEFASGGMLEFKSNARFDFSLMKKINQKNIRKLDNDGFFRLVAKSIPANNANSYNKLYDIISSSREEIQERICLGVQVVELLDWLFSWTMPDKELVETAENELMRERIIVTGKRAGLPLSSVKKILGPEYKRRLLAYNGGKETC